MQDLFAHIKKYLYLCGLEYRARAYARALCVERHIFKVQHKWKKKKSMMARVFKCSKV